MVHYILTLKDIHRTSVIFMVVIRIWHYNRTFFLYNRWILYELLRVRLIANTRNVLNNVRDVKIFVAVNLCVQTQTALILRIGTHTTKTINVVPNLSNTALSSYHTKSVIIFWCHLLATRKEQTQQHDKRFELFLYSLFLFVK